MIYIDYDEFMNIDGREYLPRLYRDAHRGYHICKCCDGTGDDYGGEDYMCEECDGKGYLPDVGLAGWCIEDGCLCVTVNKSYGECLCTEHDPTRKREIKNYPEMYDRELFK